jgi:hypothetical protein
VKLGPLSQICCVIYLGMEVLSFILLTYIIEHIQRCYEVFCILLANMYGSHGSSSDVPVLARRVPGWNVNPLFRSFLQTTKVNFLLD